MRNKGFRSSREGVSNDRHHEERAVPPCVPGPGRNRGRRRRRGPSRLLARGERDLTPEPFAERRAQLEAVLRGIRLAPGTPSPLHLTRTTTDPALAAEWLAQFEGAGLDGVVAKRQVQLGQRVQAGTPLLAVVPVHEMHVDANFKEVQLENVRAGQPVTLTADIYGSSVTYKGTVEGFSGGSGAAFAAIPAQNATGNWIKVVQRVPVRIKLDAEQLAANPLRVGLSMTARIDTRGNS